MAESGPGVWTSSERGLMVWCQHLDPLDLPSRSGYSPTKWAQRAVRTRRPCLTGSLEPPAALCWAHDEAFRRASCLCLTLSPTTRLRFLGSSGPRAFHQTTSGPSYGPSSLWAWSLGEGGVPSGGCPGQLLEVEGGVGWMGGQSRSHTCWRSQSWGGSLPPGRCPTELSEGAGAFGPAGCRVPPTGNH